MSYSKSSRPRDENRRSNPQSQPSPIILHATLETPMPTRNLKLHSKRPGTASNPRNGQEPSPRPQRIAHVTCTRLLRPIKAELPPTPAQGRAPNLPQTLFTEVFGPTRRSQCQCGAWCNSSKRAKRRASHGGVRAMAGMRVSQVAGWGACQRCNKWGAENPIGAVGGEGARRRARARRKARNVSK